MRYIIIDEFQCFHFSKKLTDEIMHAFLIGCVSVVDSKTMNVLIDCDLEEFQKGKKEIDCLIWQSMEEWGSCDQ